MTDKDWVEFVRRRLKEAGKDPRILDTDDEYYKNSGSIYQVLNLQEKEKGGIEVELINNSTGEFLYNSLENLMFDTAYIRLLLGINLWELGALTLLATINEIEQAEKEERSLRLPQGNLIFLANIMESRDRTIH